MFCQKCGKEIPDGTKFCNFCGYEQTDKPIQNNAVASSEKKSKKGGLITGWVLAVFGALSVFGSFSNGTYANFFSLGMTLDDFFMVLVQIALISIGGYLIYKKRK